MKLFWLWFGGVFLVVMLAVIVAIAGQPSVCGCGPDVILQTPTPKADSGSEFEEDVHTLDPRATTDGHDQAGDRPVAGNRSPSFNPWP